MSFDFITFVLDDALESLFVTLFAVGTCRMKINSLQTSIKPEVQRTFSLVEERQTIANFPKLSHSTIQLAQVLSVNLRKINEIGFFFKFAFALKHEQMSRALLWLDYHRHESKGNVTFLLGVFVDDSFQHWWQLTRTVVINLKLFSKRKSFQSHRWKFTSTLLDKSAVTALASPSK